MIVNECECFYRKLLFVWSRVFNCSECIIDVIFKRKVLFCYWKCGERLILKFVEFNNDDN